MPFDGSVMSAVVRKTLTGDTSAHEIRPATNLADAVIGTAVSRVNWCIAGLAPVMAFAWSQVLLLLAIPAAFLTTFAARFALNTLALRQRPPSSDYVVRLPDESLFREAEPRAALCRLAHARQERERTVQEGPRGAAFDVAPLLAKVPLVERRLLVLAARLEYVSRFLGAQPAPAPVDVREPAGANGDGPSFQSDRRWLEDERRRLEMTIGSLLAGLEALPATIVRLQCLRLRFGDGEEETEALSASRELIEADADFSELLSAGETAHG